MTSRYVDEDRSSRLLREKGHGRTLKPVVIIFALRGTRWNYAHSHEVAKAEGRPSNSSLSRPRTFIRSASSPHWIMVNGKIEVSRCLIPISLRNGRSVEDSLDSAV